MILAPFTKSYAGKTALDFPGLELPEGCTCAVIGVNGSGKSTLARCVAGALATDQRQCVVAPSVPVGYMPQDSYPFRMTVLRNVLLCGGADARERAWELMDRLEISHLARQKAHRLSGGETARMALARLLMRECALLVLDEPTAAMDIHSTVLAEDLIGEYRQRTGCAVLWVTHSLKQAQRVADRLLFFHCGRLAEAGETKALLRAPESAELKQFLEFYTDS